MDDILKALRPVKRRLLLRRFVSGAGWGFACGAFAALVLLAVTSFVPLAGRWLIAGGILAGGTLLFALGNFLRPMKAADAARAADGCGLRERCVTALELAGRAGRSGDAGAYALRDADSSGDSDMILLQQQDACERLKALDVRKIRIVFPKRAVLIGAVLLVLCAGTLLLPGGGDRAVAARQALETKTAAMAKAAEEAAAADEEGMTEKEKAELRKLTEDLKRDLGASRDEADVLVALDKAEQQLEKLRAEQAKEKTAGDVTSAMDALAQAMQSAGMDAGATEALSDAMASGDTAAMSAALSSLSAEELQKLAESLSGDAKALAEAMAQTAEAGELSETQMQAMQALSGMTGAQQAAALQQALAGMKAALAGGQGQQNGDSTGTGSMAGAGGGNKGQAGSGAGTGTTNEEQKGSGQSGSSGSAKGNRPAEFKQAEYETIYDPEKVDAATRDVLTEQNSLGKDSVQIETGPGKGTLEGDVPFRQVVGEYAQQEARAAENANLTKEQKEWVDEYFRKLTEE